MLEIVVITNNLWLSLSKLFYKNRKNDIMKSNEIKTYIPSLQNKIQNENNVNSEIYIVQFSPVTYIELKIKNQHNGGECLNGFQQSFCVV